MLSLATLVAEYGLMFYPIVRRLNLVSLRRFAYVAVSRASQDAMLFTDNAAQLGPQLAVETSKTAVLDAESGYRFRNSSITTANDGLAMMS